MEAWQRLKERVQAWQKTHGNRVFLALAFVLVAVLSFEAGWLEKSLRDEPHPVVVTVTEAVSNPPSVAGSPQPVPANTAQPDGTQPAASCAFVGSKKSDKYHHPASRCAKQIKPENRRCFASLEDAVAKGYRPGCLE